MRTRSLKRIACAAAFCLAGVATPAFSALIDWTDWSAVFVTAGGATGVVGTAGAVVVTYVGQIHADGTRLNSDPNDTGFGAPWNPTSTFADGFIVDNVPIDGNMIGLTGGNANVNSITFSQPVTNPVMAIFSLGDGGTLASFDFDTAAIGFVSGGPSGPPCCAGGPINVIGNVVSGAETNGTIEFLGTFTSISWTNPTFENFYSFTVGIPSAAPEPGSLALLGLGLLGLGLIRRRAA